MILLRIQNTCIQTDCNTEPAGWDTFVSHKGKSRKGVGLHSVTTIAEKYGGSAQFQYKDGVFITRVILAPPAYFGNVRI